MRAGIGPRGRLIGVSLGQLSPARRRIAWVLAIAGPPVIAFAMQPFGDFFALSSVLLFILLLVVAVAVIGGERPALVAVACGVPVAVVLHFHSFGRLRQDTEVDLVKTAAFVVVGGTVVVLIDGVSRLAKEHRALRRVATLVARTAPADELFASVTEEAGRLLDVELATMVRYDTDDTVTTVSSWSRSGQPPPALVRAPIRGHNVVALVAKTCRPVRIDDDDDGTDPLARAVLGSGRSAAGAPIVVEGHVWGAMIGAAPTKRSLPSDTEARLAEFTDLLATAISNADGRAGLARLATEQAALRRVATLVARGDRPDALFAAVTEEVARLLPVDSAGLGRYEPDGTMTVMSWWGVRDESDVSEGRMVLGGRNVSTVVARTGRPARLDGYDDASGEIAAAVHRAGLRSAVGSPIIVDGRVWGAVFAASNRAALLPMDIEARLASFTDLLATAVANAESRAELAASRTRIVAASDATRRRIERDLHDGTQQRLVSLGLELRSAQAAVPPGLDDLADALARVCDGLGSVEEELMEIARGIHPAILARGGLGPALKALARRSPIPVELAISLDGRLPERVEVPTYYVVSETLTNTAKHANASVVHIEVQPSKTELHVSVRDDGVGGADFTRGTGLVGLKDRVEAFGGRITVYSPVGEGTAVRVDLPLSG